MRSNGAQGSGVGARERRSEDAATILVSVKDVAAILVDVKDAAAILVKAKEQHMSRNRERGEGKVKTIIFLLVVVGIFYLAYKIIPVYVNNYELEDAMKTEARFASVNRKSPDEVRDNVYKKVRELQIPAERNDIRVELIGAGGVRITVTYTVIIDLPGYQLKLNFQPTADNMSV